jgi:hypothetical protein
MKTIQKQLLRSSDAGILKDYRKLRIEFDNVICVLLVGRGATRELDKCNAAVSQNWH